jgi:ribonuclease Z
VSFSVCILGSGAALPTGKRNPTAQYIECNNRHLLIDCGEGTQLQLRKYGIKLQRITHILISHLHGDHFFGLPGLISTMHLLGRTRGLTVYGPPPLEQLITAFIEAGGHKLCFNVEFVALESHSIQTIFEDRLIEIISFPLKHRIPTWGYRIQEKPKQRHLIPEAIKEACLLLEDLPKLKAGLDLNKEGRILKNSLFTREPSPSLQYVYCSDTKPWTGYEEAIKAAHLMYHEATFTEQHTSRAKLTYHSTAKQAAEMAKKMDVKHLLIGHFSSRYESSEQHLIEARECFENTMAAEDGQWIDLEKLSYF